jgi:hypothetical protein
MLLTKLSLAGKWEYCNLIILVYDIPAREMKIDNLFYSALVEGLT